MASGLIFGVNAALNLVLALALARVLPVAGYGALATWTAAALLVGTAAFDWIRFSAMRFYTPASRLADPGVRATLDVSFLCCIPSAALLLVALAAAGVLPGLDGATTLALVALLIGNAATEYFAALARNLGRASVYARLVALRHVLTLGIALPTGALTHDPGSAVIALGIAIWPSVIYGALALRDKLHWTTLATRGRAGRFALYGLPLIGAEAIFQLMGLVNRLWLGAKVDLAAAGLYALTFDLALRVMSVMASVTEATLLPRLVAHAGDGPASPERGAQVRRGLIRLIAAMLVTAIGTALVFWTLSSLIADVLLAPAYRAGFVQAIGTALVCAGLYVLQTYVLRPIFQLGLRTSPLLQSALLALVLNAAALPWLTARGIEGIMLAHMIGLAGGAVLLLARGAGIWWGGRPERVGASARARAQRAAAGAGEIASSPLGVSAPQR